MWNLMNKLNKRNRERLRESRLTALGGVLGGGGIKQKRLRTHGPGQQCGDCGAGKGDGWRWKKGDKC